MQQKKVKVLVEGTRARYEKFLPQDAPLDRVELAFCGRGSSNAELLAAGGDAQILCVDAISPVDAALIAEMLDHPKIKVLLNTDYASLENKESFERVFYSGPIDEYFGYELGELPYRSLRFDFVEYEREHFQSNSVINYPENHDFTRIGEYKYFLNDKSENTVVSFEYPEAFERGRNDRYYPIVRDENQNLYNRYLEKAKELKNVYFLGRLGDYKYYDMDKAVNRALALFDEVFAKKEKNNAA